MTIKGIFFDALGTLFALRGSVGEHYAAVARQLGLEIAPADLDRAFIHAWKQSPARAALDAAREDDDKPWWRHLVNRVLDQLPSVPADCDRERFFQLAYNHFAQPDVWELYPEVREVLGQLAPKYQLGIISNFDGRLRVILRQLEIDSYFERLFISSELGADKPDPEIFRRALTGSGLNPREALHVGDDPERDWAGATAAGIRVFELDRPAVSLRDLLPFLAQDSV